MRQEETKKTNVEGKRRRKVRIAQIQKAVLYTLAAAGGLTMAILAPNVLQVLEQLGFMEKRRRPRSFINRSVERLIYAGFVTKDADGCVSLTDKGRKRLYEIERVDYQLAKPKKWDGKWRLISFDITEKRKGTRDLLRRTLESVGFVRFHRSVWVYPHDCEDFLSLLKADYRIGVEVLYIIADYIENDTWLRKHFCL